MSSINYIKLILFVCDAITNKLDRLPEAYTNYNVVRGVSVLPAINKLDQEGLLGTNTLAYFVTISEKKKKSFLFSDFLFASDEEAKYIKAKFVLV